MSTADGMPTGINSHGQVAITAKNGLRRTPLRYSDGQGLETLSQSGNAYTSGINNAGDVAVNDGHYGYVFRDQGGLETIPFSAAGWATTGVDLNDSGNVLLSISGNIGTAFVIWSGGNVITDTLNLGDITALNNNGDVAGSGGFPGEAAVRYTDGRISYLGSVNGWYTNATDINDADTVVGVSRYLESSEAWVSRSGGIVPLNTLVDPSLGWSLTTASGVNNVGQIAGTGLVRGERHAFRLTPLTSVPDAPTLFLMLTGAAGALFKRRSGRHAKQTKGEPLNSATPLSNLAWSITPPA